MSEFFELAKKRYSVRSYQNKAVEEPLLLKIIEAGNIALSACNNQPFSVIVIRSQEGRNALLTVYERKWLVAAPVVLALCCDMSQSWKRSDGKNFGDIDVAIALDHIMLAATEAGLGTCWIGNFNEAEARRVLRLPPHVNPVAFTPLGYPASQPPAKKRKKLEEVVSWEFYGGVYQ